MSLYERFLFELSQPFFSLDEPPGLDGVVTLRLDVIASFAPPSRCHWVVLWRMLLLIWSLQVIYEDITTYPPHNLYIYMGYLTHWGFLLTMSYLLCSFLCSVTMTTKQQPSLLLDSNDDVLNDNANNKLAVSRLVKATWALYATVAPLEICICCLYWTAIASAAGPVTYISLMEHGVFCVLVLIDGLVVGKIPVRIPQVVLLWIICWSYLIWTLIDAVCDIGNGEWGPAYSDDALYPVLNWNSKSRLASIVSTFCLIVLTPGVFLMVWVLGAWSRRDDVRRGNRQSMPTALDETNCYKHMNNAVLV